MTHRGRGALEVKPGNSPFFVSASSEHGINPAGIARVEWAGAVNPDFAKSVSADYPNNCLTKRVKV